MTTLNNSSSRKTFEFVKKTKKKTLDSIPRTIRNAACLLWPVYMMTDDEKRDGNAQENRHTPKKTAGLFMPNQNTQFTKYYFEKRMKSHKWIFICYYYSFEFFMGFQCSCFFPILSMAKKHFLVQFMVVFFAFGFVFHNIFSMLDVNSSFFIHLVMFMLPLAWNIFANETWKVASFFLNISLQLLSISF